MDKEKAEKYFKLTGRDLITDVNACFKEFFDLSNYLKKYGIVDTKTCLNLWHREVTVETIKTLELSHNEWQILTILGETLHKPRTKEMPLVAAGIVPLGDEN